MHIDTSHKHWNKEDTDPEALTRSLARKPQYIELTAAIHILTQTALIHRQDPTLDIPQSTMVSAHTR